MTVRKLAVPPALVGIIGVTGFIGIKAWSRRGRRPTAAELMAMSDAQFGAWIHKSGLKTATDLGLPSVGDSPD